MADQQPIADELPYHLRLFKAYIEALKEMKRMVVAPDFTAAQARKIVYLEQQLTQAGYKAVWMGFWWKLEEIEQQRRGDGSEL
jgi:hypothetical protein